ncbi:MAG: hypothetical protein JKY70_16245 [Mucilaginibacter sp.]|nr:hypothetical protein [Mucilaginibacter sp.]
MLRRFLAILLLSVHLFNAGGYAIIFQYFMHRSEQQIVKQIYENKVDATQLVLLKVPMRTPGIQDWPDYEKVQGQIKLKNGFYNYVGVKMTRDTMFLVCVANEVKNKLFEANTIMAKNISDAPLSKKGQDAPAKKLSSPVSEYNVPVTEYNFLQFNDASLQRENLLSSILTHPYIESPGKPPNHLIG